MVDKVCFSSVREGAINSKVQGRARSLCKILPLNCRVERNATGLIRNLRRTTEGGNISGDENYLKVRKCAQHTLWLTTLSSSPPALGKAREEITNRKEWRTRVEEDWNTRKEAKG